MDSHDPDFFLTGEWSVFNHHKPPHCLAGDDMQMTYGLAQLSKDELYEAIQQRAAMWDLLSFVRNDEECRNFASFDDLITCARQLVCDDEQRSEWLRSYPGIQAEYGSLRYRLRRAMLARGDKLLCVYCGSKDHISIDHITPMSRGGTNDLANLQFLCRSCNSRKKDRVPAIQ